MSWIKSSSRCFLSGWEGKSGPRMRNSTKRCGLRTKNSANEVSGRFGEIDQRFERMETRLFDMQKSLTLQTRWLIVLLVAAPVIYSVMEKLLNTLVP